MRNGIIILAAGDGKRMQSKIPKVLHNLAGSPILLYSLKSALKIPDLGQIIIVGGAHIEALKVCSGPEELDLPFPLTWVKQTERLGTGHAVKVALSEVLADLEKILVLSGDLPLIAATTITELINNTPNNCLGLLTANLADPYGFGRILRDRNGKVCEIVDQAEANVQQQQITEVNVGVYVFPKDFLCKFLPQLSANNQQGEYYLTDLIKFAIFEKIPVYTLKVANPLEALSINTRKQLVQLERAYQLHLANSLLEQGVHIIDPQRLDLRGEVNIAPDVEIDINVILEGKVTIAEGAKIGANCYLKNTTIGAEATIYPNSIIEGATIAAKAMIGPFARIRSGSTIAEKAKVGNFVELKAAIVGPCSKINHLSYIGDTQIGSQVNIGAGTITCNYDGINKHQTIIEDHVSVGAGCQLIAPIVVKAFATIAAGTTLIKDAPMHQLTLNKKIQYSVAWQRPSKEQLPPLATLELAVNQDLEK